MKYKFFVRTEEIDKTVAEAEHEAEPEPEEDDLEKVKPKKIPNQFNFCERAALTYTNPMRACIFFLCKLSINKKNSNTLHVSVQVLRVLQRFIIGVIRIFIFWRNNLFFEYQNHCWVFLLFRISIIFATPVINFYKGMKIL